MGEKQLHNNQQNGFHSKFSNLHQVIDNFHQIIVVLNEKEDVDAMDLGFEKALDKIYDTSLHCKNFNVWIKESLYNWTKPFLYNRKQILSTKSFE